MGKIQGKKVIVRILNDGRNILGGQRGASLTRSVSSLDATTKDSDGWEQKEYGLNSWSLSCDGLVVADDDAHVALGRAFMSQEKVQVEISPANGVGQAFQGRAIITSYPIEYPHDNLASYSVELEGDGALEEVEGE